MPGGVAGARLTAAPYADQLLGDARQVKNIMYAVRDAYDVASQI